MNGQRPTAFVHNGASGKLVWLDNNGICHELVVIASVSRTLRTTFTGHTGLLLDKIDFEFGQVVATD